MANNWRVHFTAGKEDAEGALWGKGYSWVLRVVLLNREELSTIPILLSSTPAIGWATDDIDATDATDAGCEKGMERARDNVCWIGMRAVHTLGAYILAVECGLLFAQFLYNRSAFPKNPFLRRFIRGINKKAINVGGLTGTWDIAGERITVANLREHRYPNVVLFSIILHSIE